MAGVPDKALLHMKGFPLGVNNLAKEGDVVSDEDGNPIGLREGENIILSDSGKPSRRDGQTLQAELPGLHSLYANKLFDWMVGVYSFTDKNGLQTCLCGFNSSLEQTRFTSDLVEHYNPMSYDVVASSLYFTNGRDSGRVTESGVCQAWGTEMPGGQPTVSVFTTGGGLQAGVYQVAITYLADSGEESGASLPTELEVSEGQGISLTNIPQPIGGNVSWIRVYASPADGDVMYAVTDLPVGTTNYLLGHHVPGRALDKLFLTPMPAGQIVRAFNGRLHVATGRVEVFSEAMHYGLTKRHENYVSYHDTITLMERAGEAEGSGRFVAAGSGDKGRTYYVTGTDPKQWQRTIRYPHGAVPNSAVQVDVKNFGMEYSGILPVWLATDGNIVMGTPGGQIIQLHSANFVGKVNSDHATIAVRDFKGIHQMIAVQRGGGVSGLVTGDTVETEVWRAGVRIS